jgi:hypothetical protein
MGDWSLWQWLVTLMTYRRNLIQVLTGSILCKMQTPSDDQIVGIATFRSSLSLLCVLNVTTRPSQLSRSLNNL